MKRLILKTAAITLGGIILLGAIVLAILSVSAPAFMMDFTSSLGMEKASGKFAYETYERTGDLDCLARSFLISAEYGEDEKALGRFETLYGADGFSDYCASQTPAMEGIPAYSYRDFLTGTAARLYFRTASSNEEKAAALAFALKETDGGFSDGNPLIAIASEASEAGDKAFLREILSAAQGLEVGENETYARFLQNLEEYTHE